MIKLLFRLGVCAVLLAFAYAYSTGAPLSACEDMMPQHQGIAAQKSPFPYNVTIDQKRLKAGDKVNVTIAGDTPFNGYFAQVRSNANGKPAGKITVDKAIGKTINCPDGKHNAVTQINNDIRSSLTFMWTAPTSQGSYKVYVTVTENGGVFWVRKRTATIVVN